MERAKRIAQIVPQEIFNNFDTEEDRVRSERLAAEFEELQRKWEEIAIPFMIKYQVFP